MERFATMKTKSVRIVVASVIENTTARNSETSLLTSYVVSVVVQVTWQGIAQSTKILTRRQYPLTDHRLLSPGLDLTLNMQV